MTTSDARPRGEWTYGLQKIKVPEARQAFGILGDGVTVGIIDTGVDPDHPDLKGKVVGVLVTVYKDRTFTFEVKSPPASVILKDAVKAEKGSGEPNKNKIGKLTMAQVKELAKQKVKDLNCWDEDAAAKVLAGTARSMGIDIEG